MAGVKNPRLTGYGIIQPGAHPERGQKPKRPKLSISDMEGADGAVPLKGGLGSIKAEIARKQSINRYLRKTGGKIR